MASNYKSASSDEQAGGSIARTSPERGTYRWLRLGFVAAISVIGGGAAIALFHRKTLNRIREAENQAGNNDCIVSDEDSAV